MYNSVFKKSAYVQACTILEQNICKPGCNETVILLLHYHQHGSQLRAKAISVYCFFPGAPQQHSKLTLNNSVAQRLGGGDHENRTRKDIVVVLFNVRIVQ